MGNACASENSVQTADQSKRPADKPTNSNKPRQKSAEKKQKNVEKNQTSNSKESPKNLDLYVFSGSSACRAVMMTCEAAGIKYNKKEIDVLKNEHKSEEFLKINPNHCLPTMNDNGFILTESRAIMIYLLAKYAPKSDLYPCDLQERAIVDKWLNWDCGSFAPQVMKHAAPMHSKGEKKLTEDIKKDVCPLVEGLDKYLSTHEYLACNRLTIADFCVHSTATVLWLVGYDFSVHANIFTWKKKLFALPYYKKVNEGLMDMRKKLEMMKSVPKPEKLCLYVTPGSAPCHALMMTCAHAGIEYECKEIDLMNGEHKGDEYTKINPQQKVPTMDDNGFILTESRAILSYLVSKYAPQSQLYPCDYQKKALVDKWLCYDMGTLYPALGAYVYPFVMRNEPLSEEKKAKVTAVLDFVNSHLEGKKCLVGDSVTIADISTIASVSMLYLVGFDLSPWKNLHGMLQCFKERPYFKEANRGLFKIRESIVARSGDSSQTGVAAPVNHQSATHGVAGVPSEGLTLYWTGLSQPSRAVFATLKLGGVDFKSKMVDFLSGEHKRPEYLKVNPLGKVPTLVDGDFCLTESRAIMKYVMSKFCPDHNLYPADLQRRAEVDKWLSYDQGTFSDCLGKYAYGEFFLGGKQEPSTLEQIKKTLTFVDNHLATNCYVCGDNLTLADISMYSSVMQVVCCKLDVTGYKHLCTWMDKVKKELSKCDEFAEGVKSLEAFHNNLLGQRTSSGPVLYMDWISPNARPVYIAMKLSGKDFTTKQISLMKGEHKGADYLAINPTGQVPALIDGDLNLRESRAILAYFLSKYAPDCDLYPSDLQKRALVDQWLSYDQSTWNSSCAGITFPKLFLNKEPEAEKEEAFQKSLKFVDGHMDGKSFVCGDDMTIADLTMYTMLSQLMVTGYDISSYKNVSAWYARMDEVAKKFEEITDAMEKLKEFYESKQK